MPRSRTPILGVLVATSWALAGPAGAAESRPVLTVQTVYDQLVTARDVSYYDVSTAIAGQQDLLVQKFVQADGHCAIAPPRVGAAFDELLGWVRDRKRPTPGEIP